MAAVILLLLGTTIWAQEPDFRLRDIDNQWKKYSDLNGRKMMESSSFTGQALGEFQVDLQGFDSGVYMYRIETEEESATGRVSIQK